MCSSHPTHRLHIPALRSLSASLLPPLTVIRLVDVLLQAVLISDVRGNFQSIDTYCKDVKVGSLRRPPDRLSLSLLGRR